MCRFSCPRDGTTVACPVHRSLDGTTVACPVHRSLDGTALHLLHTASCHMVSIFSSVCVHVYTVGAERWLHGWWPQRPGTCIITHTLLLNKYTMLLAKKYETAHCLETMRLLCYFSQSLQIARIQFITVSILMYVKLVH